MTQLKDLSKRKIQVQFMMIFLFAYAAFAVSNTQILPFMTQIGYTPSQRGLILSGSALVAMIGQFLFGYLCDKYKTVKKMFYLSTILFIILVYWAYSVTQVAFFFHLISISLMSGFFRILFGLLDSWTIERDPILRKNFGVIRAFGSIGWIIGSPLTVWALSKGGYGALGLNVAILSIITLLLGYKVGDAQKVAHQQPIKLVDVKQLLKTKQYVVLLMILLIVNIAMAADAYTVVDKIIKLNGSASDISNKWVIQAISELPLFFLGSLLYKRFSAKTLLMVGIFMFVLRFLLSAFATSVNQLVMIASLQLFTFPLVLLSSKLLVDMETPGHLKSTGQLLGMAVYMSFSALVSPLISGFMVDWVGTNNTLIFFGLLCVIPLLLSLWYKTMPVAYTHQN
ncbi:MAG: major facilitator superfamily transporter [Erysipelotrichaceae bacterium]|nr:MAG: Transporter major facilitator family [Erysipelotrichaceae bacterium]TXT18415.1 MAG: major facilitator superfamily transporter [Erysipelotrichaceae bacterium]